MPKLSEGTEEQSAIAYRAVLGLVREPTRFVWSWDRPEDGKDVLSTTVQGIRIEFVRYFWTREFRLFVRVGGDCCGFTSSKKLGAADVNFSQLWHEVSEVYRAQRDKALENLFGRPVREIGFKFPSDQHDSAN